MYGRDDYRDAVDTSIVLAKQESAVLGWACDPLTARYYGLEAYLDERAIDIATIGWPERFTALWTTNFDAKTALRLVRSQGVGGKMVLLALSRPDSFDIKGGWMASVRLSCEHPA